MLLVYTRILYSLFLGWQPLSHPYTQAITLYKMRFVGVLGRSGNKEVVQLLCVCTCDAEYPKGIVVLRACCRNIHDKLIGGTGTSGGTRTCEPTFRIHRQWVACR